MGIRRRSREAAFQFLYQVDMADNEHTKAMSDFWDQMGVPHQSRDFTSSIVDGTLENLEKIDSMISKHSHHWKINRMNSVDKNVLRIGIYELLFCQDTPVKVIINEAIEIGKKFGTEESGSFINGLLDKISKEVRA